MSALWLLVSALLGTVTASATPRSVRVIARPPGGNGFRPGPVQARVGEPVTLTVQLRDLRGRALPLPPGSVVRWLRVEPLLEHRTGRASGERGYSNAVLFGRYHGAWRGYDRLEYTQSELRSGQGITVDGASVTVTAAHPFTVGRDTHGGAGSAWFSAEVQLPDGVVLHAPSARSRDSLGLSASVQRVSFRASEDFLGWLSTYFQVPYVFGSNGSHGVNHQTDRYVGADCADVLVGALRARGLRVGYTSVSGIGSLASPVTPALYLGEDGVVRDAQGDSVTLRWGHELQPGDLLAMDFTRDPSGSMPRAWDHIGALLGDSGNGGALDGADLLRNAASEGLMDFPLRDLGPLRFVVWRLRVGR